MKVQWESNDFEEFQKKIKSAHHNVDSRPLFEMYERRFRGYMTELFDSEGAAGGSRWKELQPAYAVWKGHDTIGYLTGAMRESFTGGAGYEHKITHDKMTAGPRQGAVPYTAYFSNVRPISFSQGEHRLWVRMAKQYYSDVLRNAMNPNAAAKSTRLPDGQLYTIDKSGKARIRSSGGQFVSSAASKLGFSAAKGMRSDS